MSVKREMEQLIQAVRVYMRDHAKLNRLVEGVESSDDQIAFAIVQALDDWNTTRPLIGTVTLNTHPSIQLLLKAATINLLDGIIALKERNYLPFQDGGGVAGTSSGNVQLLMNTRAQMFTEYESKKKELKIALNLKRALGSSGMHSEYRRTLDDYLLSRSSAGSTTSD